MSHPPLIATLVLMLACSGFVMAAAPDSSEANQPPTTPPFRLGVVGLVHGHVYGFMYSVMGRSDLELVGIAEPRRGLLQRERDRHKLSDGVLFTDLDEMLEKARPQAVMVFTNTLDHRDVVRACASRGIHVMMEKPLAVSLAHAREIAQAAKDGNIQVLVNYETTWYPTTHKAFDVVVKEKRLGEVHRMIARTGHQGPKELNMPDEFLDWLLDPARNGGGALYDFGCYGADLMTCMMGGQRPTSVTALTSQLKSDPAYARVDDEATILLEYPTAQGVIQASWNWPYNRKDMEIYGERGRFVADDRDGYRLRIEGAGENAARADAITRPHDDPINYLLAVVRGEIEPAGPSSLEVNVVVAEILDAAHESARTHRTVVLKGKSAR